jgi:phenylalanyl-tRNA synthetase beta chain
MNVSYNWLKAIAPGIQGSAQEIAERLAMLGAPVDEVVDLGAELGDVVIARVEEVWQHPNADRLRVTRVNAGGESVQVVCGAPNVEAGRYYPFAPVGARLPGGMEIRKAKLRGEASEGMLCSARELGLGRDHAGLMTLAGEWTPGAKLRESLGLQDWRLVVDVTPNRSELLSHVGIARELAPHGQMDEDLPAFPGGREVPMQVAAGRAEGKVAGFEVAIDDPKGCLRYMVAAIRGVRVAPSPEWLATRLRAVGLRPINNVVDATNYVLMELGQPVHAFDRAKLKGGELRIREAAAGEPLRTLDGVDRVLAPGDVVIADGERVVALGGVMGGENSEVDESTTDLLLECALFDPSRVRATRTRLGLSTDASYRFERGVDPEGQPDALERLVEVVLAVAGGELSGALDLRRRPWERHVIALRPERLERLLGVALSNQEVAGLLEPIGFSVRTTSPMRVTVPGFRVDVVEEIDLIEEIARRRGYDSFADELLPFRPSAVPQDPSVEVERRLRDVLVRWGALEARTIAFSPETPGAVPVLNPLSAEEAFLRREMLPGLLRRVEHNWAHGVRDIRLWEIGTVFQAVDAVLPAEERRLAVALSGARAPRHWSGDPGVFEAWELKALMEELARELPGGRLEVDGDGFRLVGDQGDHGRGGPVASDRLDAPAWASPVLALELRLPAAAVDRRATRYAPLPQQPATERDLALLTPHALSAREIESLIRETAGPLLEDTRPFDLYEGKGLPEGTRSVAWRLRFRAADRTLTDAEVDAAVEGVLKALEERHGVRRR